MAHTEKTLATLDRIKACLEMNGLTPEVTAKQTLRLELRNNGETYRIQHLAVAEDLLPETPPDNIWRTPALREYVYEELSEDRDTCFNVSLLLVGDESSIYGPEFAGCLEWLPLDTAIGKKDICSLPELMDWVGSAFKPWSIRASCDPVIHLVQTQKADWGYPVPENGATLAFGSLERENEVEIQPHLAEVQKLTSLLFRRVMGSAYTVSWNDEEPLSPSIGRQGGRGRPLDFVSSGEQLVFALSLFLAKAYASEQAGLYIHIPDILGRLDLVRRVGILDCLRDFLLATGASMYFESNKQSDIALAHRKLTSLAGLPKKLR